MRISDWSSDVCSSDLATLDVRLAETEKLIAEARLQGQRADGRLDPSVGLGMRQLRETGDRALIANVSVPLPVFDRNRGNISAARSDVAAAIARRENALVNAQAAIGNEIGGASCREKGC